MPKSASRPRARALIACVAAGVFMASSVGRQAVGAARADEPAKPAADAKPAWQAGFDAVYRLADGENAKLIRPPFTAERDAFHRANAHPSLYDTPGQYGFRWKDGKAERWSYSTAKGTVASAMEAAGVQVADLDGTRDLFDLPVDGDWIVREGADREAILADVQRALAEATDGRIQIEPARIEKDVVVARGRYAFKSWPGAPRDPDDIHIFTDKIDLESGSGGGTDSLAGFLRHVGDTIGQKVIDETEPHEGDVEWRNNMSAHDATKTSAQRDQLLNNLAAQTSLKFTVERREVDVWRVTDAKGEAGGL